MAKAIKKVIEVTTTTTEVTLKLSLAEATVLLSVMESIGGGTKDSCRQYTNAVSCALKAADVPYINCTKHESLYFNDSVPKEIKALEGK